MIAELPRFYDECVAQLQLQVKHITDDNCRVSINYSINTSRAVHVTTRFSLHQKVLRILLVIHADDDVCM
jgi:hypothetical protein